MLRVELGDVAAAHAVDGVHLEAARAVVLGDERSAAARASQPLRGIQRLAAFFARARRAPAAAHREVGRLALEFGTLRARHHQII